MSRTTCLSLLISGASSRYYSITYMDTVLYASYGADSKLALSVFHVLFNDATCVLLHRCVQLKK